MQFYANREGYVPEKHCRWFKGTVPGVNTQLPLPSSNPKISNNVFLKNPSACFMYNIL
jgi:hypothetical protein